jgi:hypothetical protein
MVLNDKFGLQLTSLSSCKRIKTKEKQCHYLFDSYFLWLGVTRGLQLTEKEADSWSTSNWSTPYFIHYWGCVSVDGNVDGHMVSVSWCLA